MENLNKDFELCFMQPSRWIIYGPSGCGKTTFVSNLITNSKKLFGFEFDTILYCSGQGFPHIKDKNILKCNSFTDKYIESLDENDKNLIIIDDNMHNATNDILISDLFTKKSHHKNITVMILLQNLFPKSKYMRDISISSNYIVLFKNPRENMQVKLLGRQIDGDKSNFISSCYLDATKNKPFSYLMLDLGQTTPEFMKVRTNVLNEEVPQIFYIKHE